MEYYKNILCVTAAELTEPNDDGNFILTWDNLRQLVTRGKVATVRRGGGEGVPALYDYYSIPAKHRTRFEHLYGTPEQILERQRGEDDKHLKLDMAARKFYEEYQYEQRGEWRRLDEDKVEEYTLNASILAVLSESVVTAQIARRKAQHGNTLGQIWVGVMESLERLRDKYGHTLPKNQARLREKMNALKKEGYGALVSGKLGNSNTVKFTEAAQSYLIALKRRRVPALTDSQIFKVFNETAESNGWKEIKSIAGLRAWFGRPEIQPLWWDAVHGELSSKEKFSRKQKTKMASCRDALWYGDGTKVNLYYRDEKGKVRTTMVYEVMDAFSEVLLGYHLSDTEDFNAQYHAYRMAVYKSGFKPYEIVHDNQGGHKREDAMAFFDRICHVHRTTAPYNGSSKSIESAFGRFQAQVLSKLFGFTGQNITAKKANSRPNLEFIEANKDKLPTFEQLKAIYAKAREEWNTNPHYATKVNRREMYEASENPMAAPLTSGELVNMFWVFNARPSTFTTSGITLTVGGESFQYEVLNKDGLPDHKWRAKNTYAKFYIAYDPYDMRTVRLYDESSTGALRFVTEAHPYVEIHRAIQDQQEGEAEFIRKDLAAIAEARIERVAMGRAIEELHGMSPEQMGYKSPKIKGLPKATAAAIETRTAYHVEVGKAQKAASMQDWLDTQPCDAISEHDKEKENESVVSFFDWSKTAAKLG